jgi:hypothetical protein
MSRFRRHQPEVMRHEGNPLAVVPDLLAGRRAGPELVLIGPAPSDPPRFDVLSELTELWGQEQSLLGYPGRVRCEQADASGWEFRRATEFVLDASRRLDEDDTTLQVVALRGFCSSHEHWARLSSQYQDRRHEDFDQLGAARFTGVDHTGSPVCVFRSGQLVIRVRMTGTLAQRQYTRVYALDAFQHLDWTAVELWQQRASINR